MAEVSAPRDTSGRAPRWLVAARAVTAVCAGLLIYASYPPRTWWWLAPVGLAVFWVLLHGRRARAGFGYGLLTGLGFLLPLLFWTGTYVGAHAAIALATLEALFVGGVGAAIAVTSRLPGAPVIGACLWVAGEAARARMPFDGFPWGRLAFGQPDGPLLPLVSLGGVAVLSLAVALCGFGLGALIRALFNGRYPIGAGARRPTAMIIAAAALVTPPLVASLVPDPAPARRQVVAAVIQGNVPRLGLDFNAQRRAVLDNHVARTVWLAEEVNAGRRARPDLVIWPENSSDIDPYRNTDAANAIAGAAAAIQAPIAVGAVLSPQPLSDSGPVRRTRNTVIVWQPGQGPGQTYTKRHLQPFGEYIPWRGFVRLFSSDVERVTWEFQAGDEVGVLRMGPALVGVATCYEVAFDYVLNDAVTAGAQVLAVPTNNATFGLTEMTHQQLAMSRVRAVEHDRAVLVAATSGVSAVIDPDGSVRARTGMFTPDALVETVPIRTTATLATRLGALPEWLIAGAGMVILSLLTATRLAQRARGAAREDH